MNRQLAIYLAVGLIGVAAPLVTTGFYAQFALLWIMVTLALCWDVMGGQMGYNSFGNVTFFGIGMYTTVVLQVGLFYSVGKYTQAQGAAGFDLSFVQYFVGLGAGLVLAGVIASIVAAVVGSGMLGLRGHYFAIGTLGLGIAFGELFAGWDWVGAGSGIVTPLFPGELEWRSLLFYYLAFLLAIFCFFTLKRMYATRFGLAINAIRDDEDKAEAMGLPTTRYKTLAWTVSAFFTGIAGGIVGNISGFIDPRDVAFSSATYGVWMILMAILGGKGTIWGPVIGAVVFQFTQELFWTYLLGWQRVALGLLIVLIVVFFPSGIVGWLRERFPERFGVKVETAGASDAGGRG